MQTHITNTDTWLFKSFESGNGSSISPEQKMVETRCKKALEQ